jgi:hypothetical protein
MKLFRKDENSQRIYEPIAQVHALGEARSTFLAHDPAFGKKDAAIEILSV